DTCVGGTVCSEGSCILSGGKVGEACSEEHPCQQPLYCKGAGTAGVCTPKATIGEACSWQQPGGTPCLEDVAYCAPDENRCRRLRKAGEACGSDMCEQGLVCSDQVCIEMDNGWIDQPCSFGCRLGLHCVDGYCRRLPGTGGKEGQRCASEDPVCAAGLLCTEPACNGTECPPTTAVCRRFAPGDACGRNLDCPEGMWCEVTTPGSAGVCRVYRDLG